MKEKGYTKRFKSLHGLLQHSIFQKLPEGWEVGLVATDLLSRFSDEPFPGAINHHLFNDAEGPYPSGRVIGANPLAAKGQNLCDYHLRLSGITFWSPESHLKSKAQVEYAANENDIADASDLFSSSQCLSTSYFVAFR